MVCDEIIKEKEKQLGRKLTAKEKKQIMMAHGHTEQEAEEELALIYA